MSFKTAQMSPALVKSICDGNTIKQLSRQIWEKTAV